MTNVKKMKCRGRIHSNNDKLVKEIRLFIKYQIVRTLKQQIPLIRLKMIF